MAGPFPGRTLESSRGSREETMSPSRWIARSPVTLAAVALLAGCGDAVTVHSVVLHDDPVPDVPSLVGRWQPAESGGGDGFLEIEGNPGDLGRCREGSGRYRSGSDEFGAKRVCFVELDGYLVAEIETTPPTGFVEWFYRQYLVRVEEDRLEVCGGWPVWAMFQALAEQHPVGYSLDALKYTTRESEFYSLMVLISKPEELREFLRSALPELAAACDTHTNSEIAWAAFERVPEEDEESADDEADQEAAEE